MLSSLRYLLSVLFIFTSLLTVLFSLTLLCYVTLVYITCTPLLVFLYVITLSSRIYLLLTFVVFLCYFPNVTLVTFFFTLVVTLWPLPPLLVTHPCYSLCSPTLFPSLPELRQARRLSDPRQRPRLRRFLGCPDCRR